MEDASYDELRCDAKTYYKHHNHNAAIEIFSELLQNTSQDSLIHNYILFEYAECLLDKANYEIKIEYKMNIEMNMEGTIRNNKQMEEIEEDIETCWYSLENCRNAFEIVNDRARLARVHKAIGDVQLLNNNFKEAIEEYEAGMDYNMEEKMEIVLMESKADAYIYMEEYNKAIKEYKEIIKKYKEKEIKNKEKEINKYEEKIEVIRYKRRSEGIKRKREESDEKEIAKDVNHRKK